MKKKLFRKDSLLTKVTAAALSVVLTFGMTPAIALAQPADGAADDAIVALDTATLEDGIYKGTITASLGMLTNSGVGAAEPYVVVSGNDAYLVFTTGNKGIFPELCWAQESDLVDGQLPDTIKTYAGSPILVEGATLDVSSATAAKACIQGLTFVLPIEKSGLEAAISAGETFVTPSFMARWLKGYSDKHPGEWSDASMGYTFSISGLSAVEGAQVVVPQNPANAIDYVALAEPTVIEYPNLVSTTSMFPVSDVAVIVDGDSTYLRFVYGGESVDYVAFGTYETVAAAGDGTAENGNGTWVKYTLNDEGKRVFLVLLPDDLNYVPITSVSASGYKAFVGKTKTLMQCLYGRGFRFDYLTKSVTVEDYTTDVELKATVSGKVPTATAASLHTVGGASSNSYAETLTVATNAQAAYLGAAEDAATATTGVVETADGKITITLTKDNYKGLYAAEGGWDGKAAVAFKLADGSWADTTVTVDKAAKTVSILGEIIPVKATVSYTAQAAGAFLTGLNTVEVSSDLADSYGYADSINPNEAVSAADVMVAANIAVLGKESVSKDTLNWNESGFVNTLFNVETYNNGFLVNGGYPNDGTESQWGGYNGTTITTTKVSTGDLVEFYIYQDSSCLDAYAYMDAPAIAVAGQSFDVTLSGSFLMMGYMFEDAAAMKAAAEALEGVSVALVNPENGAITDLELESDEDGKASVTLTEAGEYYLVAYSMYDEENYEGAALVMTPAKVTVYPNTYTVKNNVKMFKTGTSATLSMNGEALALTLPMANTTYDKAYVGTAAQAAAAEDGFIDPVVSGETETFTFPVSGFGEQIIVAFHSSKGWYDRIFTVDLEACTVTVDSAVSAEVTYAAQAAGAYLAAPATATVSSTLAESYGYIDSIDMTEGVSAADVLVAANLAIMGEVSTDVVDWSEYGYVSTLFGVETSANGFLVNKGYPNDGTESQWGGYNGTTITTTKVVTGDVVDFFIYQDDTSWSDILSYVDAPAYAAAGQPFEVTVSGTYVMMGYLYEDAAAMKAAAQPLEEVTLGIMDSKTGEVTALEAVTNEDGVASVTLPAKGEYYLVACSDEDTSIIMNPTKVTAVDYTIAATTSNDSVRIGDTVTVDITAASAKTLGAGEFTLNYDGTLLKLISIKAGKDLDLSGEGETTGSFEATLTTGKVSFYGNNAAADNIVIATATFEALAEGTAQVSVSDVVFGAQGAAKDVAPAISGSAVIDIRYVGSFEISSKDYTATKMRLVTYVGELPEGKVPTLKGVKMAQLGDKYVTVVTAGEAAALTAADLDLVDGAAARVRKDGDVNNSGTTNIVDAQIAYDIATGVYGDYSVLDQKGFLEADVNGDKFVDAADALAIQNYVHRGSFVK